MYFEQIKEIKEILDKKSLIFTLLKILTTIANILFLEETLNTRLYLQIIQVFLKFLNFLTSEVLRHSASHVAIRM